MTKRDHSTQTDADIIIIFLTNQVRISWSYQQKYLNTESKKSTLHFHLTVSERVDKQTYWAIEKTKYTHKMGDREDKQTH